MANNDLPSAPVAGLAHVDWEAISVERLVDIAAYIDVMTAELVRSRLASEGIPSRLENNDTASSLFAMASGGIKVQVLEENAAEALEILRAIGELGDDEGENEALEKTDDISLARSAWRSSVLVPIFPPLLLWSCWLLFRSFALEEKSSAGWKRPASVFLNTLFFAFSAYVIKRMM